MGVLKKDIIEKIFWRFYRMIKRASCEDISALENLLGQVLYVHHLARPDLFKPEGSKFSRQELEELLEDDQKPVFVFVDEENRILGHLFTIIQEHGGLAKESVKTLFIDDLCVDETARGQKIGEQLYQYALAYAREIGCYNVTLDVWNANQGALRFYERLGLIPQMTVMEQILD